MRRVRKGLPHENNKDKNMNIAVFASGRGTNFSAILRAIKNGSLKVNLALLVCDQPGAGVLSRARRGKVKIALIKRSDYPDKAEFERKIIDLLRDNKIDIVVMAGFMRVLSPDFVKEYKNRIVNIHPALLPSFKGVEGIKDAFSYGVKVTGVTVHIVDEEMDHGPIILQEPVKITEDDTLESLEAKVHKAEHKLYPKAISLLAEGRLKFEGRKVRLVS